VTDTSGAAVPGAKVSAVNVGTGAEYRIRLPASGTPTFRDQFMMDYVPQHTPHRFDFTLQHDQVILRSYAAWLPQVLARMSGVHSDARPYLSHCLRDTSM
jgi:hypothetical protein